MSVRYRFTMSLANEKLKEITRLMNSLDLIQGKLCTHETWEITFRQDPDHEKIKELLKTCVSSLGGEVYHIEICKVIE